MKEFVERHAAFTVHSPANQEMKKTTQNYDAEIYPWQIHRNTHLI